MEEEKQISTKQQEERSDKDKDVSLNRLLEITRPSEFARLVSNEKES